MSSSFTYFPTNPQPTQIIATSQPQLLSNAGYLNEAMLIDHSWQGSALSTEAAGSHQTVSMPNQPTDITSLQSGIAAQQYCIGANIYAWNGAKAPMSGVAGTLSNQVLNLTPVTIVTLPASANAFGMIYVTDRTASVSQGEFATFTSLNGVISVSQFDGRIFVANNKLSLTRSGLALQINTAANPGFTSAFIKYIYWPI